MGLYFEEFTVGQTLDTAKRTITENDIMTFAELSGDDNRIHTDPEFSKTTQFGRQIAHGMLGLSIASGLAWKTGILDGTVIAFREVNEWKFVKPVFIGDSIYVELEVKETKALPRIGHAHRVGDADAVDADAIDRVVDGEQVDQVAPKRVL